MKKIVNGRLFDTNESVTVCSWRESAAVFGIDVDVQFTLCREKVAEKPMEGLKLGTWGGVSDWDVKSDGSKGDFFLAVEISGTYDKGRIRPVDVDEARRIYEEHTASSYNMEDEYLKYFGVRPQKPILAQLKEAFAAGAEAKQKQYEEAEARKKAEIKAKDEADAEKDDKLF